MSTEIDTFKEKFAAKLEEWKADLGKLQDKAGEMAGDAKDKLNETVAKVQDQLNDGDSTLGKIAAATEDTWEDVKTGAQKTWDRIVEVIQDTKKSFEKETPPADPVVEADTLPPVPPA